MKDIIYTTPDGSIVIRLQFIIKNSFKQTHLGKGWPKHTQCLMYTNGLLECFETVVKHEYDADDQVYACKLVAEKCLDKIQNKWISSQVRLLMNNAFIKYSEK